MADLFSIRNYLNKLKQAIDSGKLGDALVSAIDYGNGLMQQRIFTRGQDILGQSFGEYIGRRRSLSLGAQQALLIKAKTSVQKRRARLAVSPLTPYQRKRVAAGRQIGYKDLEFEGEVRRAIQRVIENERTVTLAFNNDHSGLVARGQEQQIQNIREGRPGTTRHPNPTPIFTFSDDEINEVIDQATTLIVDQVLK